MKVQFEAIPSEQNFRKNSGITPGAEPFKVVLEILLPPKMEQV